MDSSGYFGFIELFVALSFLIGWGVLELVGQRLDRKREAERDANTPAQPPRKSG